MGLDNGSVETGEVSKPSLLRDLIKEAIFSPTLSISFEPRSIDLGPFGEEAEGIMGRTLSDPQGLERARIVYVTRGGKVLIQQKDIVGQVTEEGQYCNLGPLLFRTINVSPNFSHLPRNLRQDKYVGLIIHSHGFYELPFSPQDLAVLFSSEMNILASPALFVVTPERKHLLLRTAKTPQWDILVLDKKIKSWASMVGERIMAHVDSSMPFSQQVGINAQVQHSFIRQVSEKYHLLRYSCRFADNIALRESA